MPLDGPFFGSLNDARAKSQNQQMTAELHAIYRELSANNFSMQGGGLHFA
jgi:hypothetical protein